MKHLDCLSGIVWVADAFGHTTHRNHKPDEVRVYWLDKINSVWIPECSSSSLSDTSIIADLGLKVLNNESFNPSSGCHANLSDVCSQTSGGFLAIISAHAGACDPFVPEEEALSPFQITMIVLGVLAGLATIGNKNPYASFSSQMIAQMAYLFHNDACTLIKMQLTSFTSSCELPARRRRRAYIW